MPPIEVRPVEFPREIVPWVRTWWRVYGGDPHWVPPLISDQRVFLDPARNPYFRYAEVRPFQAFRDGVAVGTLAATVDRKLQEHEPGVGLFGFFEFVDDPEVSAALWGAGSAWLRERGMRVARGPFNFNTNHEFGLLVDGFDTDPCIGNPHNSAYFESHYQRLGMRPARDWFAYWFDRRPPDPRMVGTTERFMKRHPDLHIRHFDRSRFDDQVTIFWDLYNDAWSGNWGHVFMSEDEFRAKADALRWVLDPRLAFFAYLGDEPVAAAITLPDYNQVVKRMNGRILPFGWWHFLRGRRRIDRARVLVLGVKRRYQHLPLGVPLYVETWQNAFDMGMVGAEASLVLEDNARMRQPLERMGARVYKTYRTFQIGLDAHAETAR